MKKLRDIIKEDEDSIRDSRDWKKVGQQLGSNPGGTYRDEKGKDWYVKHSKSPGHAKNEILATHMYKHMGVPTLDHELVHTHSGLGTTSPITKLTNFKHSDPSDIHAIQKHFGAHAFLANWDTIGAGDHEDDWNQAKTHKGMTTLDSGGALNYRAQGAPKGEHFGNNVSEFHTLRDKEMNRTAGHIFGQMKPHQIIDSVKPVANFRDSDIHRLVHQHGPGTIEDKNTLVNKLIARKKDLIGRANSIASKHGLVGVNDIDD